MLTVFLHSNVSNLNSGNSHSEQSSSNELLAVQTPASNFTINTKSVSDQFCINNCFCSSIFQIAAYPGETIQLSVSFSDEQNYSTSEIFHIFDYTNAKVGTQLSRVQLTFQLNATFQGVKFTFNHTAQAIDPSQSTFAVKYSMKDAAEITDNMLKNNYTIEVQALRSHSHSVSEATEHSTGGQLLPKLLLHYLAGER